MMSKNSMYHGIVHFLTVGKIVFTVDSGGIAHFKITEFRSTSDGDGFVWSRRCTKQGVAESLAIENRSETS